MPAHVNAVYEPFIAAPLTVIVAPSVPVKDAPDGHVTDDAGLMKSESEPLAIVPLALPCSFRPASPNVVVQVPITPGPD
jgi:hypothetical protein